MQHLLKTTGPKNLSLKWLKLLYFFPGYSPFPVMALSVFCVACLVGTAMMVYKKSRKNPPGYSVLANGYEQ